MEAHSLFNKECCNIWVLLCGIMNIGTNLTPFTKICWKWIIDLHVKHKNYNIFWRRYKGKSLWPWARQRFPRYDTTSKIHKITNWLSGLHWNLKHTLSKTLLKEWKCYRLWHYRCYRLGLCRLCYRLDICRLYLMKKFLKNKDL